MPVFVMVTVCGALDVPVITEPKFRLIGAIEATGTTAVPVS